MTKATRLTLGVALLAQGLWLGNAPATFAQKSTVADKGASSAPATPAQTGGALTTGATITRPGRVTPPPAPTQEAPAPSIARQLKPVSVAVVDFAELARQEAMNPPGAGAMTPKAIHPPLTIDDTPGGMKSDTSGGAEITGPGGVPADEVPGPSVPSPAPSQNFNAQEDGPKVGTTAFTIPPDTMGAVGLDKVFTQTNSNFRIHDKATGAALSTVNADTFWAAAGGTGVFDPRVVYDPYNNRWITAIVSNAQTANSSVEIGISDTSDPQGTYHLYRFIVGCAAGGISPITGAACNAGGEWADYPMLGFSKGWVGVTWNQFTNAGASITGRGIFIDYPNLRTGPVSPTAFTVSGLDFCTHPAATYDANEVPLHMVAHLSSGGATYRKWTLSGNPPSLGGTIPSLTNTGAAGLVRPGGGWTQPGGDIAPQQCVGTPGVTCPTTLRRIDSGDAFVRSNVIYRNGNIYYPQTVSLPAGTAAANDAARLAVQWTAVNATTGAFVDGGRVEDPTATKVNGGKHYIYPGIAVNKSGDILLGFTQTASNQFASAGYTFRIGTDAAGTMRDPVIYKAGEDYYSKAFSGTRNRWGDYSHAQVDPSNDRDLWTIQEYAGTRTVPDASTTTNNSRWGTWWAKVTAPASAGDLLISEFRLRGPGGATDEFVEIYNNNNTPFTVTTVDGSAGYAVAASDGVVRCTIPNNTVIPARGHYLCVNSAGYSLASYPAGNGTTATGDATYTTDIPDNAGIALFNTATPANFSTATKIDAVGSASEANTLYKEGTGYPAITSSSAEYSFFRKVAGSGPCTSGPPTCTSPTGTTPVDTDNNGADFFFADTAATPSIGAGQRLGAPGPENLSSPIPNRIPTSAVLLLDATVGSGTPPNRVRDLTSDPPNNSTFGTLSIRRRVVNNTGAPVTRLRFRVTDISTFPPPTGTADLRARTSTLIAVSGINDTATCSPNPTPCAAAVQGTTLEQPPSQTLGGGYNSSLSAGTVTLATPLAAGASVNVQFLLGVQQTGTFKVFIIVEALP